MLAPIDFGLPHDIQRIVCEGTWFFPEDETPAPVFVIEQRDADGIVYYVLFNRPVERPWYVEAMDWAAGIVAGPIPWDARGRA